MKAEIPRRMLLSIDTDPDTDPDTEPDTDFDFDFDFDFVRPQTAFEAVCGLGLFLMRRLFF
ncbi:MAG: hypothetical protein PHC78_03280 [Verrucomicrobiota bacterium]|nr:hypothetical protein [Verrucomicrobiota bacterium]